jgi:hypothetical protein
MNTKSEWVKDPLVKWVSRVAVVFMFLVTSAVWIWAPSAFGYFVAFVLAMLLVRVTKLEVHNGL